MARPQSPFERFSALDAALKSGKRWYESATYLRHAAIAAISCEGEADELAREIRETARELKRHAGWFSELRGELRYVVAAVLRLQGDRAESFLAEVKRVRAMFRRVQLRRDVNYESVAILVLRIGLKLQPVEERYAQRLREHYEELKRYHWWLTGPDDYPACAMFALRHEPAGLIAQRLDQIFDGLIAEGLARCSELQSAAQLLYLCDGRADQAVTRAGELMRQFKSRRQAIRRGDYDEIAILSYLLNEPDEIVDRVLECRDRIRTLKPKPDRRMALSLGAHLALLDLMRYDDELPSIGQCRLLLDVLAVLAARRATAAVIEAAAG